MHRYPTARQLGRKTLKAMGITPEEFERIRTEKLEREPRAPAVGALAPDFNAERLSPQGRRTGERFCLSEARGRPVALVFGSYT